MELINQDTTLSTNSERLQSNQKILPEDINIEMLELRVTDILMQGNISSLIDYYQVATMVEKRAIQNCLDNKLTLLNKTQHALIILQEQHDQLILKNDLLTKQLEHLNKRYQSIEIRLRDTHNQFAQSAQTL